MFLKGETGSTVRLGKMKKRPRVEEDLDQNNGQEELVVGRVSRKSNKSKTHVLNVELADLARRKLLKEALKKFYNAKSKGGN